MYSDGSRCGEKTMSGTAGLSVKATPRGRDTRRSDALNKRGECSTHPRGARTRGRSHLRWARTVMAAADTGRYHPRSFFNAHTGIPMSSYTTNEIRGGMKLLIDGDPYS